MFDRLKRLYEAGQISKDGIENALKLKWITKEQAEEILNPPTETTEGTSGTGK